MKTSARRSIRSRRWLALEHLERRETPAIMTWDGGGGTLEWTNALNWAGDVLPGPADDVQLDPTGNVTVQVTGGAVSIKSLQSFDSVQVLSGTFNVSNGLAMSPGLLLQAQNFGSQITINGPVIFDGVNLTASAGGTISVPGANSYDGGSSFSPTIISTGVGSDIELPNLKTLKGAAFGQLRVYATQGGVLNLPMVTAVNQGGFDVFADQSGSQVSLPLLTDFTPDRSSFITATNGGVVSAPLMSKLRATTLTVGAGTPDYSALTDINASSIVVTNGATLNLPNVVSYNGGFNSGLVLQSVGANSVLNLPNLNDFIGSSFGQVQIGAFNGGTTNVGSLSQIITGSVALIADGAVSKLSMPALTSVATNFASSVTASNGGTFAAPLLSELNNVTFSISGSSPTYNALTDIDSSSVIVSGGAKVSLPSVSSYDGLFTFNAALRADGAGSQLTFPNLVSFKGSGAGRVVVGATSGGTTSVPQLTQVVNGGVEFLSTGAGSLLSMPLFSVLASNLTSFITVTDGGVAQFPILGKINGVSMTIRGGTPGFPSLTNIDNSAISVDGGVTLLLANVLTYDGSLTFGSSLQAINPGSKLDLPNLSTIIGATFGSIRFASFLGGRVNLPNVVNILNGGVEITADGPGSVVDMPTFVNFSSDRQGILNTTNGGIVNAPNMSKLRQVTWTANGVQPNYPNLTNIDGSSVIVSGGLNLSLTKITSYDALATFGAKLQATGANTVLDFPGLISFKGSTSFNMTVGAFAGGTTRLPAVTQIQFGGVDIIADDPGAVVDLPVLTNLSPDRGCNMTASDGGVINVPVLAKMRSTTVNLIGGSPSFPVLSDIDGCSVIVSGGAKIDLAKVTSYNGLAGFGPVLQAKDSGSALTFSKLTNFIGSSAGQVVVGATLGGTTKLPLVTTITAGGVALQSIGAGSLLSMPLLTTFAPDRTSAITVNDGGVFDAPQLKIANNTIISTQGGTPSFPALSNIDGSSVIVSGGAVLSLPLVTSYDPMNNFGPTLKSTGAGSRLDLTNLTNMKGSASSTAQIGAFSGGDTRVPNLVTVTTGGVEFIADDPGSKLELNALQSIASDRISFLTATDGGAVLAAGLKTFNNAVMTLNGGSPSYPLLTSVDASSISIGNGAKLSLPGVTSYDAMNGFFLSLQATGPGSQLDFPNLTSFKGSTAGQVRIGALSGGVTKLNNLASIVSGGVELIADQPGSQLQVTKLGAVTTDRSSFITATNGGTITAASALTASVTTITLNPTGKLLTSSLTLGVNGVLQGNATFTANVLNGGEVRPGGTPGSLTIAGNYTQTALGKLSIDLGGSKAGTYDTLVVTGTATLDGTLQGSFINAYAPASGDTLAVLQYGSHTGKFATVLGVGVLNPSYDVDALRLNFNKAAGPFITTMSPSGLTSPPIGAVTVTFSEPINDTTFTTADVTLTGPAGAVTVDTVTKLDSTHFAIGFAGQSAVGKYTVTVGPTINNLNGDLMNQDGDSKAGEAGEDAFVGTFTVPTPARVQSVVINDGSPQRSRVTSITVTFDNVVTFKGLPSDAFNVTRNSPGAPAQATLNIDTSASTPTNTIAKITFTGGPLDANSLADGNYSLTVFANQFSYFGMALDGNNDGQPGGNNGTTFHRYFGDSNGDTKVDSIDFGQFRSTFNLQAGNPAFLGYFDFNNDGKVDSVDFGQFRTRFNTTLSP